MHKVFNKSFVNVAFAKDLFYRKNTARRLVIGQVTHLHICNYVTSDLCTILWFSFSVLHEGKHRDTVAVTRSI